MTASPADDKLRVIIDAIPTWIARIGPDQRVCYANAAFREHVGDACGKRVDEVVSAAVHAQLRPHLERAFAGEAVTAEILLELRWVRIALRPDAGRVIWLTDDITHNRGVGQLAILAEASRVLAAPIDVATTRHAVAHVAIPTLADWAVVFLESVGAIVPVEVAGDERVEAIARAFVPDAAWDHPVPQAMRSGRAAVVDLGDSRTTTAQRDAAAATPAIAIAPLVARGRALGALLIGRATRYEAGELALLEELARRAGTALDTAQLFEAEYETNQRLTEAMARQREADRKKDAFLAILGHELRNPLAPIVTALDLMTLSGKPEFEREREVIRRQADHLTRLVEDLLDLSRVTREKLELRKEPYEILTVICHAVEIASPLLEARKHRLVVDVPRVGLVVQADLMRLGQVFANLLTNAAKYTEPGGRVVVAAIRDGEQIAICVEDNGQGISKSLLPDVFDPFIQSDRTIDRAQGGLGLGLSLVRSIAQLHGGSVSVHSDGPGRGSRFTVRLPGPSHVAAVRGEHETTAPLGAARPRARVLVVDDNADAADSLASLLREVGYEVAIAHDAPNALRLAASFRPAIALLDIELPVMDGYELARHLRDRLAEPPRLVAVSGYGHEADVARSRAAGFDVHLGKPVRIDALVHILGHLER